MRKLGFVCAVLWIGAIHHGVAHAEKGIASYYGDGFHGRMTACGNRFDMHKLTAAHKRLPCGTVVQVTRADNGRSVFVTIDDRGPFVRNRVIDLSKAAARELNMLGRGTARVSLEVVDRGTQFALR